MMSVYVFSQKVRAKVARSRAKKAAVEKNPLVTFYYPMSKQPWNSQLRQVRLIAASATHLMGLEMTKVEGRTKYHFKRFCQPKVSEFKIQEFNPSALV